MDSTFKFSMKAKLDDRDSFYAWIWREFTRLDLGLMGIHEGSVLSEEAAEQGFETESWTVDSGLAPRGRDWVGQQSELNTELYFAAAEGAERAREILSKIPGLVLGPVEEQKPRDWDAEWKASFLNAGAGVEVPPFWRVVPPWVEGEGKGAERFIKINPGAGFGTGTHEATQLCMQAIGEHSQVRGVRDSRALDFGSGSGILSITLAKLGADVDAVEIDPLAIENAQENAQINAVVERITFYSELSECVIPVGGYSVVVANILRPILIEFAEALVERMAPESALILSGLIDTDVPHILQRYDALFRCAGSARQARVLERGEWRAVVYELTSDA